MTSHQNDMEMEMETTEADTLQVPQRDIDIPMPGVHITIVKEEDCMFAVFRSQAITKVPSLCYLCSSSLRQVQTMRYMCVHNHKIRRRLLQMAERKINNETESP